VANQPPKDKEATRHEPIVSDTLVEGAEHNNQDAKRTRKQTERIREVEDHARQQADESTGDS
jgi:hypothetical protein